VIVPVILVPSLTDEPETADSTKTSRSKGMPAVVTEASSADMGRLASLDSVPEHEGTDTVTSGKKQVKINRDKSPGPIKLPSNYKTNIQIQPSSTLRSNGINIRPNGKLSRNASDEGNRDGDSENGQKNDETNKHEERMEVEEGMYLKSKLWWLGLVLMAVGEGGNFLSYGFAPASVVAPLGTVVSSRIFWDWRKMLFPIPLRRDSDPDQTLMIRPSLRIVYSHR